MFFLRQGHLTLCLIAALLASSPSFASTQPQTAPFTLPPLPYAVSALEPAIDTQTMTLHHDFHHKAYVDNLNAAIKDIPTLSGKTLEQLLAITSTLPPVVRNNAGGHWNHSEFWKMMAPVGKGGKPSAALEEQIKKDFGSLDAFKERFNKAATGRFVSGWAWMILTSSGLQITSTPNQDNPLMDVAEVRGQPLLALDVWEHAYYLKYKYKRADYLNAWWTVVNWNEVNHLFEVAKKDQHKRIINPQH